LKHPNQPKESEQNSDIQSLPFILLFIIIIIILVVVDDDHDEDDIHEFF